MLLTGVAVLHKICTITMSHSLRQSHTKIGVGVVVDTGDSSDFDRVGGSNSDMRGEGHRQGSGETSLHLLHRSQKGLAIQRSGSGRRLRLRLQVGTTR